MLRPILGFVAGMVVAFVVVFLVEAVGHMVYPPPGGILTDMAAAAAYVATAPPLALAFPLIAWVAGAFLGGAIAAFIGRAHQRVLGSIVGGFLLAGGVANMIAIPHPIWFALLAFLLVLPAGWLGGDLVARRATPSLTGSA